MKHKIKIKVWRDDSCDGFAAYLSPSILEKKYGEVLINIEATFHASAKHKLEVRKFLIENIMHEVGHACEEYLGGYFSEKRMERVIAKYRKKYKL